MTILTETDFVEIDLASDLYLGVHPIQGWAILNQNRGGGEWSDVIIGDERELDAVIAALTQVRHQMRKVQEAD